MLNNHSHPSEKCTFELLSAYLDGEVSAKQREEVEQLLAQDYEAQRLYQRLLHLRQEIHNLPTPQSECSARDLCQSVFARVDQEERQHKKRWLWGGSAIAALVVATLSGVFSESRSPLWQMANNTETNTNKESLIIAFNEPLINIPEANNVNASESLMIPLSEPLFKSNNEK